MCTFFVWWSTLSVWFLIWGTNISLFQFTPYISNKLLMLLWGKHCFSSSVFFFFFSLKFILSCLLSDFNNFGSLIHKKVSKICHVLRVCTKSTLIQYIWYTLTVMLGWMLIEFVLKVHVRDIHCLTIQCILKSEEWSCHCYFQVILKLPNQICKFDPNLNARIKSVSF